MHKGANSANIGAREVAFDGDGVNTIIGFVELSNIYLRFPSLEQTIIIVPHILCFQSVRVLLTGDIGIIPSLICNTCLI